MMLALAIGDAYGSGFEYAPDSVVAAYNDGTKYVPHPKWKGPSGVYTDDTQMSLAVAEALLAGEPWTPQLLADHFVYAFKRDPRTGYASKFYEFLKKVKTGDQFLAEISNESDKSGGAMRAAPIGILPDIGDVLKKSRIQAALTHNTTDGMHAAMAASLMSHYFIHGKGPKDKLGEFICNFVPGPWKERWEGPVGAKGWMSVWAAITAVRESSTMKELLIRSIGYTGDVDTVAAIAAAAAAHCPEIENDILEVLYNGLENGTYGRDYIIDIDRQLLRLKS